MKINELESGYNNAFTRSTGNDIIDSKIQKISMMSPDEYLKQAFSVTDERLGGSFNGWMGSNQRTQEEIEKYASSMKEGHKFPLTWINYDNGSQDGRNRALAAKIAGFDKIPVGIIPAKDTSEKIDEIIEELKTSKGYKKFRLENELQRLRELQNNN